MLYIQGGVKETAIKLLLLFFFSFFVVDVSQFSNDTYCHAIQHFEDETINMS